MDFIINIKNKCESKVKKQNDFSFDNFIELLNLVIEISDLENDSSKINSGHHDHSLPFRADQFFLFCPGRITMQTSAIVGAAIGLFDIVTASLSARDHNRQPSTFELRFSRDALTGHLFRAPGSPRQSVREQKSYAKALVISLLSTGFPVFIRLIGLDKGNHDRLSLAFVVMGATMGPSTGHFYAKKYRRGFVTAGLRLILWSLFINKVSDIEYS